MPYENIIALILIGLVLLVPLLKWAKDRWMPEPINISPYAFSYDQYETGEDFEAAVNKLGGECFVDFFETNKDELRRELERVKQWDRFPAIYRYYGRVKAQYCRVMQVVYSLLSADSVIEATLRSTEEQVRASLRGSALNEALSILEDVRVRTRALPPKSP